VSGTPASRIQELETMLRAHVDDPADTRDLDRDPETLRAEHVED